ncbi:oxidoreductase-like domain-containing protein [Piscinibacter sp. XHJ-5]|uniref:oxidoreductase-like domain-containing protein n=1 Tax=Piscinibacter sp. XHJ-5 TaxID=3037797 RepID=UPI00245320BA|nr:oxidoreductase-like domain-containing protein [Piscinibacter sp. XHJ-5]
MTPSVPDPDPEPIAPIEPDFEACCGNGCEPCIFDIYGAERDRYLVELRAWQQRQALRSGGQDTRP